MNPRERKLDQTLVWDETGCLADPAIHALADGEVEVLPPEALSHAETCRGCADQIGSAALLALEVAQAMMVPESPLAQRASAADTFAPARLGGASDVAGGLRGGASDVAGGLRSGASDVAGGLRGAARRRPIPVTPLWIALAVAFVAILPSLNSLSAQFIQMQAFSAIALPLLAQLIAHSLTRAVQSGLLVWIAWLSAGLLLLGGLAIARLAKPQRQTRSNS